MKNNKTILFLSLLLSFFLGSCNEFLDELPDNRTELDSKEKIQKLLVSAYPSSSHTLLTELSSDNVEDFGSNNPYSDRMTEQMTYWEDVSEVGNDSPIAFWESCYNAIAHSNQALDAIKSAKGDLSAEKGEALITRAYAHFILVNVFGLHYNNRTSTSDLGIPYLEAPETTLDPKYKRNTVAEVYEKINRDIEEALPLIKDDIYDVKSYHFNTKAAYAFAARFNLYYQQWEKAEKYASVVLTNNPTNTLRDWQALGQLPRRPDPVTNAYILDNSNLLTQTSYSNLGLHFGAYYSGSRFNHTRRVADQQTLFAPTPWSNTPSSSFNFGPFVYSATNLDKTLFYKIPFKFEYTDAVAGIGYRRSVLVPFNTDETLLVRAEAKIMQGLYDSALEDINIWSRNFYTGQETTLDQVNNFYNAMAYSSDETPTQKKNLNPKFSLTDDVQENMIHYVLQCRRILTLHEGLRWFDVKRYGITINRYQYTSNGEYKINGVLKYNDLRKAIQIPKDVISAGLTPNPR